MSDADDKSKPEIETTLKLIMMEIRRKFAAKRTLRRHVASQTRKEWGGGDVVVKGGKGW
jgi:hypothetical protein